jgi:hypothetical protein
MTEPDPRRIPEFLRPHHGARKSMTALLITVFRDDWEGWSHEAPDGHPHWSNYYDSVFLARLNLVGETMGWEAPVFNELGVYDDVNLERKEQWKKTYHVMRAILLAEVLNQIMASERFNHLLDEYGTVLNSDVAIDAFKLENI